MILDDVLTMDNLLHVVGGAAIAGLLLPAYWNIAYLPLCVFIAWCTWGLLREQAQLKDKGFFSGVQSFHKICEGLAWGVGGLLMSALPLLFGK